MRYIINQCVDKLATSVNIHYLFLLGDIYEK